MRRAILLLLILAATATAGLAAPERPALLLEDIVWNGLGSTPRSRADAALGLHVGDEVDQAELVEAVTALRELGPFQSVEFFTRPGSARGRIVLVLEVTEKEHVRSITANLGTGNSDNDGWYLIPVELGLRNVLDERDQLSARFSLGYRFTELSVGYRSLLGDGRAWWGAVAAVRGTDRYYVLDGLEVRHTVGRGALGLEAGRRFGSGWTWEGQLRRESANAHDEAHYASGSEFRDVNEGEVIPTADLPPAIADDLERRGRTVLESMLTYRDVDAERVAFSPVHGSWARVIARGVDDEINGAFPFASLDLRAYRPAGGGVLAARWRGAVTTDDAPFYDRLYLGGLYTVRGVPSHGLTEPGGASWLWNASLEYRAPLSGDRARPGLAGALFVDLGQSGNAVEPEGRALAVGAGWGLRWRLFGIVMGADFAVPVTGSPVEELFHGSFGIGWSF
ncbi:MAG TPA: BamA/TamA family outer membrane protein [Candidatus Krumholzibacteria bacterium]|nr:BamA/TamA family outer membrane protein [Candidatus Krumholzibacteria bacterium]HRX52264.1 BamA/TamA family outer membrane protein [Candidatus Krumholzibacteria bacterium]